MSVKEQGVSLVEGPINKFPAYKFRLPYGNVPILNSTLLTKVLNSTRGFTIVFLFRQQKNNLGTLLSVNSPGRLTPWLQLTANSKTGMLTLKYRLQKIRQFDWNLPKHRRKSPLAGKITRYYIQIHMYITYIMYHFDGKFMILNRKLNKESYKNVQNTGNCFDEIWIQLHSSIIYTCFRYCNTFYFIFSHSICTHVYMYIQ